MIFLKILFVLVLIFVILIFKKLFSKSKIKSKTDEVGEDGEKFVSNLLLNLSKKYKVFNDVMFFGSKGTIQIDHIVLSENGIFVIETKNYKGEVFGNIEENYWKKVNYGEEKTFYNPIFQNKAHISALKMILQEASDSVFYSIVAFSDNCDIQIESDSIVHFSNLLPKIESIEEIRFSDSQLLQIESKIKSLRLDSKKYAKKHVQSIQKAVELNGKYSEYGTCPKCNGLLLLRNGKKGFFYGCENYPKCKYVRNYR